jgi:hypothetical protein
MINEESVRVGYKEQMVPHTKYICNNTINISKYEDLSLQ